MHAFFYGLGFGLIAGAGVIWWWKDRAEASKVAAAIQEEVAKARAELAKAGK